MYITNYQSKTFHNFKIHSITNINLLVWIMTIICQAKDLWQNLTLPKHIHVSILEINENATLVFSIFFKHGLVHQHFIFIRGLYFIYSIKWSVFVLTDCQYALFKSTCYKTSYKTPCNVPHEWFEILNRVVFADWVDNIFPTSKCRYVFFISKYLKIKSGKILKNFRAGGSGKLEGRYLSCVWNFTPFRLYLALI